MQIRLLMPSILKTGQELALSDNQVIYQNSKGLPHIDPQKSMKINPGT